MPVSADISPKTEISVGSSMTTTRAPFAISTGMSWYLRATFSGIILVNSGFIVTLAQIRKGQI